MDAKEVVLNFWKAMETNDFRDAGNWLADDYRCHWPQSSEMIIGRANFIEINTNYPANGKWTFCVNTIISEESKVATDVSISDGIVDARAITFHTVRDGLIMEQTEFWPENVAPPDWRKQWVSSSKPDS